MKKLTLSIIPALVVVVALLAFYPVFTRGYFGDEISQPETGQFVSCEELQLAIEADESNIISFFLADFGGSFIMVHASLLPVPTASDPDYKPILMSGTGQIIESGDETTHQRIFYMNLHYSQEHADQ